MSGKTLVRAWNEFFFQPESPVPIAVFRILLGLLVLIDAALLSGDWLTWYGPKGLVTFAGSQQIEGGPRLNVFAVLPQTEFWSYAVFWVLVVSAALVCVGLFTRASSIVMFVMVASMHQRNLFMTNSGDTLLRCSAFFLMFAPAGAALSLDRLRNIWKGREGAEVQPRVPWAQRMIQIELSLLYFMTFWNKSLGPSWIDGTAVYYVNHLDEFRRFPLPSFLNDIALIKLQTWFTLAAEFSLGVLVWIKELRYPILAMGVLLHVTLEYTLNVPMFQWTTLALYVTFLQSGDLEKAWAWFRDRAVGRSRTALLVSFDASEFPSRRAAEVLRALDPFGRLRLVNRKERAAAGALPVNGLASAIRLAPRLWIPGRQPRKVAVTAS